MSQSSNIVDKKNDCTFCQIAVNQIDTKGAALIDQNAEFYIINDIKPHATVHLLVISDRHIPSVHDLRADDAAYLDRMEAFGRAALAAKLGHEIDENRLRIGFHQPPLLSVAHLHLHLCYPTDSMDFISYYLLFRRSPFFKSVHFDDSRISAGGRHQSAALISCDLK